MMWKTNCFMFRQCCKTRSFFFTSRTEAGLPLSPTTDSSPRSDPKQGEWLWNVQVRDSSKKMVLCIQCWIVVAPSDCICKNCLKNQQSTKDGSAYFHHSIDISYSNLHLLTKSHSNKSPVGKLGVAVGVVMTLASTRGRELTGGRHSEQKREIVSSEKIQDNELKTAMIMSLHIVATYCIVYHSLSFYISRLR